MLQQLLLQGTTGLNVEATERSRISALERAEKSPALATIFSIADALNIPAAELLGLVEQRPKAPRR